MANALFRPLKNDGRKGRHAFPESVRQWLEDEMKSIADTELEVFCS